MDHLKGLFSVVGRLFLVTIFLMSAAGNKIPNFSGVVGYMENAGVPFPQVALALAIGFLLVGGVLVLVGYYARLGAALLAVFLVLATYYFHPFWKLEGQAAQAEMIQAMKNLSMLGAMLFVVANGSGAWSLDNRSPSFQPGA
ncbi:MAG: DoxX family protein [Gemmataceae bacterium]